MMGYVEGFVLAVPTANKEEYRRHAAGAWPLFREFGASRLVEAWGDDVPEGKVTDFRRAVQAKEDETVVFSWFEYPSREARDAANEKIMTDPRMKEMGAAMPFDGQRMIFSGFVAMLDRGPRGTMGYTDGFVAPVPLASKESYCAMAEKHAAVFADHGALRAVEAWGDDIREGKVTDFRRAVIAGEDENVVFSWIEWPSKDARVAGWAKVMEDERMKGASDEAPFDGKRLFWGGFEVLLDTARGE